MNTSGQHHCEGCGRVITSARSIAACRGRWCQAKLRRAQAAQLAAVKPEQHAKAVELIEQRGIVATSRPGVFRTVASKGDAIYLTHSATCTCPAGLHGRLCYHSVAARIILAASARRAA